MITIERFSQVCLITVLGVSLPTFASDFAIGQLTYEGAFRIPIKTFGDSRIAYANGTIAVNDNDNSFFVVGHSHHQAIAEFEIPELSTSSNLRDLKISPPPMQNFITVFDKVPSGNSDNLDRITGMEIVGDSLIVNGIEFYDADTNAFDTTFIIENSRELSTSGLRGFFGLDSGYHSAGWISEVPYNLVGEVGSEYIFGSASNFAINSRSSIGPTAFSVQMNDILGSSNGSEIQTTPLIDFSLENPLHEDRYNKSGENDLWTETSVAHYGFIVPGTRTYAVFGASSGHNSGIGYKITQDTGNLCGGPCPYVAGDRYNYYWLWHVDDLVKVKNGSMLAHQVRPYEYGKIELSFQSDGGGEGPHTMIGVDYNPETDRLYILLGRADTYQSAYESAPIMLVYSTGRDRPSSPMNLLVE